MNMKILSKYRLLAISKQNAEQLVKSYVLDAKSSYQIERNFDEILKYFPNDSKEVIYRGLSFYTEDEYNDFVKSIKSGIYKTSTISSWTTSKNIAIKYAKSRQFYMDAYTPDMAQALDLALKLRTKHDVAGFRGIVLTAVIEPNAGIDVRKVSNIEQEIILPKGTYKVKFADVLSYKDKYKDKAADAILNELDKKDFDDVFTWLRSNGVKPIDLSSAARHNLFLYTLEKLDSKLQYGIRVVNNSFNANSDFERSFKDTDILVYCTGLPSTNYDDWFLKEDTVALANKYKAQLNNVFDSLIDAIKSSSYLGIILFYFDIRLWAQAAGLESKLKTILQLLKEKKYKLEQLLESANNDIKNSYDMWNSKYSPAFIRRIEDCLEHTAVQIKEFSR